MIRGSLTVHKKQHQERNIYFPKCSHTNHYSRALRGKIKEIPQGDTSIAALCAARSRKPERSFYVREIIYLPI